MAAIVSAPAQRARPETDGRSEDDRPLPVLSALEPLFSTGGLRRGSAVTVRGSASLLLALLAGPSRRGAWCGVVGLPGLGLVAAAEAGIDLERLALVPDPGRDWAAVAAALLDAMEVVVVAPPGRVVDGDVRRLAARARQRGAVLVPFGPMSWPGAELRLSLASGTWEGLGDGSGHLRARRVLVRGEGRGSAARARELALWLPGPDGEISAVPEPALHAVPSLAPEPLPSGSRDAPHLRAVPDLPAPVPPAPPPAAPPAPAPEPEPVVRTPEIAALWQDVLHRPGAAAPDVRRPQWPEPDRAVPAEDAVPVGRRPAASRARPAGNPVPSGRPAPVGGGPLAPPPTAGPGPHPAAAGAGPHPVTTGTGAHPVTTNAGPPRPATGGGPRPTAAGTGSHPATTYAGSHPATAGTEAPRTTAGTGARPVGAGTRPVHAGAQPVHAGTRPVEAGTRPVHAGAQPVGAGAQPVHAGTRPVEAGTRPVHTGTRPVGLGAGGRSVGGGGRPAIPAEVLARLRPASSLPRPPRAAGG